MIGDLLQTKLFLPPARPSLVPRPRLVARLERDCATCRLTLISAPAGFGKTTLAAEWIRTQGEEGRSAGWLGLDEADNDPVLFWSYVLAALGSAGLEPAGQLLAALAAPSPPPLAPVITQLLNDLAGHEGRIILVLDDYHVISEGRVHEQLGFLVDHLPPQLHMVLLTRADPPLPLSRWRARREMTEVRQVDLRFDQTDAHVLLNELLDLNLDAAAVAVLEERTEGWVAGLQMAALALERHESDRQAFIDSFAGSHHYIMTYLLDEVLERQDAGVQAFLEQTVVLRRLSAPLCTAVTGQARSAELLGELVRRNLFVIPLDETHTWYRIHHLFADLLLNRLEQRYEAAAVRALQRRAAEWYETHGFIDEAIYHALRCGNMAWAAQMVEKHARPVMQQGRLNTLLRWILALPVEVLARRPRLRLDQAWSLFLSGAGAGTREILLDTRRTLQAEPHLADDAVRGELAALMANCAAMEEDVERVMVEVQEALTYLPDDDADLQSVAFRARTLNAAGIAYGLAGDTEKLVANSREVFRLALMAQNLFLAAHALSVIAEARFHQGRLREAAAASRQIVELAEEQGGPILPPFAGMGHINLAGVQAERHELQEAAGSLEKGLAISGQGGIGYKHLDAYCFLARLRGAVGDQNGAWLALEQAEAYAQLPLHKIYLAAYAVRLCLGENDLALARRWLAGPFPGQMPVVISEVLEATRARLALAEGDWNRVLALHDVVVESAARAQAARLARVVEMALLKALAAEALGDRATALDCVEKGLVLAAPEGARMTFLELGPDLAVLIRALRDQGRDPQPFTDQLLRLFPATAVPQAGMVEPLSARELEVLRLIAAGKSNKEIAAALVVTLNTVKKHSSHIYEKLHVNGRTQAVARARELDLL